MHIQDLVIEVTRRCNMRCDHCLRGNPQRKDMDINLVNKLFNKIDSIGTLTLTGGEPSRKPEIIYAIRMACYHFNVSVGSVYCVANGKNVPDDFVNEMYDFFTITAEDRDACQLQMSGDNYHEGANSLHKFELLEDLNLFSIRDKDRWYSSFVVRQGRGEDFGRIEVKPEILNIDYFNEEDPVIEGILSLNPHGEIIAGCNWSYKNQKDHVVCTVDDNLLVNIGRYIDTLK